MKANRLGLFLLFLLVTAVAQSQAQQNDADRKLLVDIRAKAERGDAQSQCELGSAFYDSRLGVAKDAVEAVNWFRKAAEKNLAKGQYNLGVCYYSGEGVARNEAEAVNWCRKAAEQNDANAERALATWYIYGQRVPYLPKEVHLYEAPFLVVTNPGSPARVRMSFFAPKITMGVWSSEDFTKPEWVWRTNLVTDGIGFGEVFLPQNTNPRTVFLLTATNDVEIDGMLARYISATQFEAMLAARPATPWFRLGDTNVLLRNPAAALMLKSSLAREVEERVRRNPAVTNWIYEDRDNLFRLLDDLRGKAIAHAQAVAAMPNPDSSEVLRLAASAAMEARLTRNAKAGRTNMTQMTEWDRADAWPGTLGTNTPASHDERVREAIERIKATWPLSANDSVR